MINYIFIIVIVLQSIKIFEISILYYFSPLLFLYLNRFKADLNIAIFSLILLLGSLQLNYFNFSIPLLLLYFISFYNFSKNSKINVTMIISYTSFISAIVSIIQVLFFININGIVFSSINGDLRVSGITQSPVDNLFLLGCGLLLSTGAISNSFYTLAVLLSLARSLVFPLILKMFSGFQVFKNYLLFLFFITVVVVFFQVLKFLSY